MVMRSIDDRKSIRFRSARFLTLGHAPAAVGRMVEAGEAPFLAKPFDWDALIRAVRETIHGFDTKRAGS
jgi:FixJ family two-component response regulator